MAIEDDKCTHVLSSLRSTNLKSSYTVRVVWSSISSVIFSRNAAQRGAGPSCGTKNAFIRMPSLAHNSKPLPGKWCTSFRSVAGVIATKLAAGASRSHTLITFASALSTSPSPATPRPLIQLSLRMGRP